MKITKIYLKQIIKEELQKEGFMDMLGFGKKSALSDDQKQILDKYITNNPELVKTSAGNLRKMATELGKINGPEGLREFEKMFNLKPYGVIFLAIKRYIPVVPDKQARDAVIKALNNKANTLEGRPIN